ncbi:MAG: FtsX-like permease family protein [Cellulomonas sp.]
MSALSVRTATGWRAATAHGVLVARRRSGQDAGLLTLSALLLAVTVLLALVVPRVVLRMADEGVQQAVTDAGPSADVVATIATALGSADGRQDDAATLVANAAAGMEDLLPAAVGDITDAPVTAVQSPSATIDTPAGLVATRLVHVASGAPQRVGDPAPEVVRWVSGLEPRMSPAPTVSDNDPLAVPTARDPRLVEVGVSASAAGDLGLAVGDRFAVKGPSRGAVEAVVTGLYEPLDAASPLWSAHPDLLGEVPTASAAAAVGRVGLLLSDASLPDMQLGMQPKTVTTIFRFPARPEHLSATGTDEIERAVVRLVADPSALTGSDGYTPIVTTELGTVLRAADARLLASTAQASVLLIGLATVGALALVLAARLLVVRRERFLLAERARGASVASVVVRALVESVPLVALATAVGALGAWLLEPDARGSWTVAALVAVVAAVAPAIAAGRVVRGAWTGRRLPANRVDRERLVRRRRVRRLTAELALVAIAAAALVSVHARGLLQTTTGGVDLLLASTPVLLATAATLLAARALPPVLRSLSRLATHRRGLTPVIATARASSTAGTRVPLLTLTVAVALVVFCGTTAVTVQRGQLAAADIVVGAPVRLDGTIPPEALEPLRDEPGVTAVAGALALGDRTFGKESGVKARLLLVDAADLAAVLTAAGRPVDAGLAELGDATGARVPALITPALESTADLIQPAVMGKTGFVDLDVVGTAGHPPVVPVKANDAPAETDAIVIVDRARFEAASGIDLAPSTVWVDGPGAADAVRAAGLTDAAGVTVTERATWLADWRSSPLTSGLLVLLVAVGIALAGYAAVALVLTVVATSRERGRTLSALRTLGLDGRTARAMTFGELAPLAIAALLAGTAVGIAVPWMLTGALGLDLVTGAAEATALQVTWVPVVGAAAVVLAALAVAVVVESAVRRRDRLGEVLRVGER